MDQSKKRLNTPASIPLNKVIDKMENFTANIVLQFHGHLYFRVAHLVIKGTHQINLFIDDEIIKYLVRFTMNYAKIDYNDLKFEMDDFIGILFVTVYNTRPRIENYWSSQSSLECKIIRDAMARDRLKLIKEVFPCVR